MSQTEFELTIHINTAQKIAYAHLADLANHPGLQPLVIETQEITQGQNEHGEMFKRFYSIERFRFLGVVPYHNKITVLMTLHPHQGIIVQEVNSFPNIYLRSTTSFKGADEGTAVHETVTINCPSLLMGYVLRTAVAAHQTLMQNLKTRLESELVVRS